MVNLKVQVVKLDELDHFELDDSDIEYITDDELDQLVVCQEVEPYRRVTPPPIPPPPVPKDAMPPKARKTPEVFTPRQEFSKRPDLSYQTNLFYANMVRETLADPDADPFIKDIFYAHFMPSARPEPKLIHQGMIPFPTSESGLSHLDHYPTAGIQYMVKKLAAETKERPFAKAELVEVKKELAAEADDYHSRLGPTRRFNYRFAAHGSYKSGQIQDMLYSIARENS